MFLKVKLKKQFNFQKKTLTQEPAKFLLRIKALKDQATVLTQLSTQLIFPSLNNLNPTTTLHFSHHPQSRAVDLHLANLIHPETSSKISSPAKPSNLNLSTHAPTHHQHYVYKNYLLLTSSKLTALMSTFSRTMKTCVIWWT
jgi:hypothetical protein